MEYWTLVFLTCAVVALLFAVESITNSVALLSALFAIFFVLLFAAVVVYDRRRTISD